MLEHPPYKTKLFISKANQIHGERYDYSKVNYINAKTKVTIICSEHGEFQQTPSNHLCNYNCQKCAKNFQLNTEKYSPYVDDGLDFIPNDDEHIPPMDIDNWNRQ